MLVAVWLSAAIIPAFTQLCLRAPQACWKANPWEGPNGRTFSLGPLVGNVRLGKDPEREQLPASHIGHPLHTGHLCPCSSWEQANKASVKDSGPTQQMLIDFISNSLKGSIKGSKKSKAKLSKQWENPDTKNVKLEFSALLKYDEDQNVREPINYIIKTAH